MYLGDREEKEVEERKRRIEVERRIKEERRIEAERDREKILGIEFKIVKIIISMRLFIS